MNHMHVLGLLLAFMEKEPTPSEANIQSLLPSVPLVHLYKKPVGQFTLRELTTQVLHALGLPCMH